jgi:hypothetical protein
MDLASLARDAILAVPEPITRPAPLPEAWRELLGLYADGDYYQTVRLEWRDGKLTFVDPGEETWRPTLQPTAEPDTFLIERGVRESGEPCTFERTADGRIRSVRLASTVFRRLDAVE